MEKANKNKIKYTYEQPNQAYDIHVNGSYHASIRYSELLLLHERLRTKFQSNLRSVDFPPKKFFKNLDEKAVKERRIGLHIISILQDSFRPSSNKVSLDIYLADGSKESIRCGADNSTEVVLKVCVRLLGNHESPYISLHLLNQKSASSGIFYYIMVRKIMWHKMIEEQLLDDPGAVILLYKQKVGQNSPLFTRLQNPLKLFLLIFQLLRLCYENSLGSFELLESCITDYPQPNTNCNVKIGFRSIILQPTEKGKDYVFRVTRIRMWRLLHDSKSCDGFSLQFEYFISKNNFLWINVLTKQAILLTRILQTIGFEILKESERKVCFVF
ncbi:unnamed protein product [Dracunculus medinensis]|uniref:PX domain-containing protein n=1 Tax=Dracunculus medinensis TaxID=318479 RepID=A0A0N4UIL1_DRAME|nr:unnamed protein product [Dracunculus medinensis]